MSDGHIELEVIGVDGMSDHEISGFDTTILVMPKQFYVAGALAVIQFGRFLRELANQQAADLGERLHHADFVITTDPAVVQSRGSMHDCDECRAGVQQALRILRENPKEELIIGQLYWAGRKA